jgi:hypothetical protein
MSERITPSTERRFTRAADPSLSDEANRLIDRELEDATGARVEERPAREGEAATRAGTHSAFVTQLVESRMLIGLTLIVLLIAGLVVGLATGAWIVLVGLVGLHAVGTSIVAAGVLQLTTETEHVSPELSAALEAEGVADPDRMFTNLVADVSADEERRGPAEVAAPGHNERTATAQDDPARSTAEQRTALTPSSRATPASDAGPGIAGLPWYVVTAMMVFSIVVGAIEGGAMWIATAVVLVAGAGWIGMDRLVRGRLRAAEDAADDTTVNRTALVVLAAVVLGVMAFMSVMGIVVAAS